MVRPAARKNAAPVASRWNVYWVLVVPAAWAMGSIHWNNNTVLGGVVNEATGVATCLFWVRDHHVAIWRGSMEGFECDAACEQTTRPDGPNKAQGPRRRRRDSMTGGPHEMLGTKWPSITSRWR